MTASDFMLSPSMKARARPDPTNDVYSLYVLVLVDDEGLAFFMYSMRKDNNFNNLANFQT